MVSELRNVMSPAILQLARTRSIPGVNPELCDSLPPPAIHLAFSWNKARPRQRMRERSRTVVPPALRRIAEFLLGACRSVRLCVLLQAITSVRLPSRSRSVCSRSSAMITTHCFLHFLISTHLGIAARYYFAYRLDTVKGCRRGERRPAARQTTPFLFMDPT